MESYTWSAIEQGDSSSTDDVESPRSVVTAATIAASRRGSSGRWRKSFNNSSGDRNSSNYKEKEKGCLHSQVLRIKEEEMQISEDLNADYCTSYNYVVDCHSLDDIWCRTILPASPLGSKRNN